MTQMLQWRLAQWLSISEAGKVVIELKIEVTNNEHSELIEMLRAELMELKNQLRRTEGYEFKEQLKQRKYILEQLLERLTHPTEALVD